MQGAPGSVPGPETRSHMMQLRLKILSAATKTHCSQIKIFLNEEFSEEVLNLMENRNGHILNIPLYLKEQSMIIFHPYML